MWNRNILRSERLNILFRVDASKDIGIGHVMRCMALSEEFIKKGHICYFLTKTINDNIIETLKKRGKKVFILDKEISINEDLTLLINYLKMRLILLLKINMIKTVWSD